MRERRTFDDSLRAVEHVIDIGGVGSVRIGTDMSVGTGPDGDLVRGRSKVSGAGHTSAVEAIPLSGPGVHSVLMTIPGRARSSTPWQGRGYREEDIARLLGGNFLRAFGGVWGG